MSDSSDSVIITFRDGEFGYEPTFDGKFIDQIYQLILHGNTKEIKKIISTIKIDREKNENEHADITIQEYSDDDEYNEMDDGESEGDFDSKIADIILPNGFKPLILAAQVAIPELVEYFLSLGFDVNGKDQKTGATPILAACCSVCNHSDIIRHSHNIKECVRLLVDSGASLTCALFQNNEFALHLLAANNYIEACEYLLPLTDNIDCRNDRRCTPLMLAASKGHLNMVKLLLEWKADKSLRNINGHTSVELAMVNGHQDIVALLVTPADNLEFYRAWSVAHHELVVEGSDRNISETFSRNFSSRYQDDPIGYMCTNLNLPHLQPILDRNGVTFSQLRCMSDTDLKKIGVTRFADRKKLLNIIQETHKFPWNHDTSIFSPDYKKPVKPSELIDVIETVNSQLDFMASTVEYLCRHLTVNGFYYDSEPRINNFLDKISNHCEVDMCEVANIEARIVRMESFFDKMYDNALDEDVSCQLDEGQEKERQRRSVTRYPHLVKTGVVVSGLSLVLVLLYKFRVW